MSPAPGLSHRGSPPDLGPRAEAEIEWWYVQGWVERPKLDRLHVMASLFRMRHPTQAGPSGAMLIQQTFDPATGAQQIDSRITPGVQAVHDEIAARVAAGFPAPLQGVALRRHRVENARRLSLGHVVVDAVGPSLEGAPLALRWNGFSFTQTDDTIGCVFALPGHGRLTVSLSAEAPWLDERSAGLHPDLGDAFAYVSCPRLAATGTLDGQPVRGRFWVDRQWGHYDGWLLDARRRGMGVLGWDWFGLNLDDGRDLLVSRHHDPAARRYRQSWGVVFGGGAPRGAGPIGARPLRSWVSPRNGGAYPVAWALELPEHRLSLRVEPLTDDQEIPVFGTGAIWEGAVSVSGRGPAGPVSGSGRLELVGYGTPLTLRDQLGRTASGLARALGF